MNALKQFAWLLTLAAISLPAVRLYAQQEIDPDHFEATASKVQKSAPQHVKHSHTTMAAKAKHHHKHAAA